MTDQSRKESVRNGLRPALGVACRAALREIVPAKSQAASVDRSAGDGSVGCSDAAKAHLAGCPDCQARVHASGRLAAWVAAAPRPIMPAAMSGRASELLERIHERVVERAESGPLGAWVDAAHVAMPEAAEECGAEAVVGERARLASRLISGPPAPEAAVWSQVRQSILDTVAQAGDAAAERTVALRSSNFRWLIMFAGAAASVAIGFLAISSGGFATGGNTADGQPQFVLVDLGRAPDMDYAVARYGLRH